MFVVVTVFVQLFFRPSNFEMFEEVVHNFGKSDNDMI